MQPRSSACTSLGAWRNGSASDSRYQDTPWSFLKAVRSNRTVLTVHTFCLLQVRRFAATWPFALFVRRKYDCHAAGRDGRLPASHHHHFLLLPLIAVLLSAVEERDFFFLYAGLTVGSGKWGLHWRAE